MKEAILYTWIMNQRAMSNFVADLYARNEIWTAKLLQQGYRYHKLRKTFSKHYRRHCELVSKFNCWIKKNLHQVKRYAMIRNWYNQIPQSLSEPEFYDDLVYKFKKIEGKADFFWSVQKNYRTLQMYWI